MRALKLTAAMASLMGSGTFIPFSHKPHPTGHGAGKLWPQGYSTPGFLWTGAKGRGEPRKVLFRPDRPSTPDDPLTRAGRRRIKRALERGNLQPDRHGTLSYGPAAAR